MKLIILLIILLSPTSLIANPILDQESTPKKINIGIFEKINLFFGGDPVKSAVLFKESINKDLPDREKLKLVNDYINKVPWKSDISHWNVEDYWASPKEFLETNGGDCEDFAIAKMILLNDLIKKKENLKLVYTLVENDPDAHMVLIYHEDNEDPLVLDNIVKEILPISERKDLNPVYAINQDLDLWLVKDNKLVKIRENTDSKKFSDLLLKNQENPIEQI